MRREVVLNVEAVSPISTGGYDTKVRHSIDSAEFSEPLRPTSIRGVWRWWIRAFAAGVAFDKGLDEVKAAVRAASELLGSAKPGESRQASFQLWTSEVDARIDNRAEGMWGAPAYRIGSKFKVAVRLLDRGMSESKVRAGLSTLICSLILGGVGRRARRGLGSLSIEGIDVPEPMGWLKDEWGEIVLELRKTRDAEAVKGAVYKAVEKAYGDVLKLVEELKVAKAGQRKVPRVPAISRKIVGLSEGRVKTEVAKVYYMLYDGDAASAIKFISDMCARGKRGSLPDKLTKDGCPEYILGLPRHDIKPRRASPLLFHLLATDDGATSILATTIISSDWPSKVRGQPMNEEVIINAIYRLRYHLTSQQYKFEEVWP